MRLFLSALILTTTVGMMSAHARGWAELESNGQDIRIYETGPADASAGVLLVHDWFGVSDFYEETAEHLGDLGYRVLAVDLYHGEAATTHAEAWALMQALDGSAVASELDLALSHLGQSNRQVAVMGFSMGVPYALDLAARNGDRVRAAAVWYGDTGLSDEQAAMFSVPVLAVYGSLDGDASGDAARLSQALANAEGSAETFIYPDVAHAFAQPLFNGGDNFSEAGTAASWALTEEFLRRELTGG